MEQVDVLLGLQWGDEGKGKIVEVCPRPLGKGVPAPAIRELQ